MKSESFNHGTDPDEQGQLFPFQRVLVSLGYTISEIHNELNQGKLCWQIAEQRGMSRSDFDNALATASNFDAVDELDAGNHRNTSSPADDLETEKDFDAQGNRQLAPERTADSITPTKVVQDVREVVRANLIPDAGGNGGARSSKKKKTKPKIVMRTPASIPNPHLSRFLDVSASSQPWPSVSHHRQSRSRLDESQNSRLPRGVTSDQIEKLREFTEGKWTGEYSGRRGRSKTVGQYLQEVLPRYESLLQLRVRGDLTARIRSFRIFLQGLPSNQQISLPSELNNAIDKYLEEQDHRRR